MNIFHNLLCRRATFITGKVFIEEIHSRAFIHNYKTVKRKTKPDGAIFQIINQRRISAERRMPSHEAYGAAPPTSNGNESCRTCTDFKYWSNQQRQIFHKAGSKEDGKSRSTPARPDCPLDKGQLGAATWALLHTIGAFYPENPTSAEKKDMKTFFDVLARVYPCTHCAADFQKDLSKNPIQVNSQHELTQWLCNFHNRVNVKLGKPKYDCSKTNQRWRDGWLDGSCD